MHGPWATHIEGMDRAVEAGDTTVAVRAWRDGCAAALDHPGWAGLVQVAAASVRMGVLPGMGKACESRARETYWTALFRARKQGSINGVLQTAEAFGSLGDRGMVEQCIKVAEALAALGGDADAASRVRTLTADLVRRYVDVAGVA
jgi:hypothetical protein